jgi:hypothetical protein
VQGDFGRKLLLIYGDLNLYMKIVIRMLRTIFETRTVREKGGKGLEA